MAKKIFTDESLATLVDETKAYVDNAASSKVDKVSGKGLSTNDYTTTEKNKLSGIASGAEVNQNAFGNVKVGTTTIAADSKTDTLTLVGSNITITPNATDDSVTFTVADGSTSAKGIVQLTNSTSSTSTTTAATPSSVKSAYDLANTAKTNAATAQTKADSAYSLAESKVDSLSDLGITATATELNYVDGVTSNVQTQLDTLGDTCDEVFATCVNLSSSLSTNVNNLQKQIQGKADLIHNHTASEITSGTIAAARLPAASGTSAGITIVYPADSCTTFSSDSGTVTPLAVQKGAKMFAITRPSASTNKAVVRYNNTTGDVQDSKILIEDVTNTRDTSKKANVLSIPAEGGKKMVYGYCTDQVDGTSFIGGVFDANATEFPYSAGLAIGGTSGNLLWKGARVATATDLDTKQATITGGASTITSSNLTANRALVSNTSGKVAVSAVTSTELGYLDGVTSNVQTQLDAKPDTSDLGFVRIVSCSSSDGVTYTGTASGVTALTSGLTIVFVSSKTSASKTPTLNLNSLGAKSIKRRLSHLSTSTQEGYSTTWLYANKPYLLVYDGTQWIVDGLTKPSAADLYGTPAAATKATQDGNGNVIVDTYATKASIPTAATIADSVVDLLKDRGDTIVGAVNSNNDITLVSGLADGVYTLKYENSDGTTTSLGYFNMSSGNGNITSYRNWFDVSTATLNQRWSNSSFAWTTSSGTGHVVTDYIPVTLSTDTNNPTIMRFRGATFTGNASIVFYTSSKTIKSSATAGTDGVGMQISTTSVTTDENGDYQISLGYKNNAFDSAWTSGVAYMRVGLYVGSSALTTDSVKDIIITINQPIDD